MSSISAYASDLGVTRLCHLTPYRNLLQIARGVGIRSVADLNADERAAFDPQDLVRLDNHPDHISCSVQYPNPWYLRQKRRSATPEQRLFPDWVCLLIDLRHLDRAGTKFCHRNAAAAGGSLLQPGLDAFKRLYDDPVEGKNGPQYRAQKPSSCPTDDQAEVMVPKLIPLIDTSHIVVSDEAQARRVYVALDLLGVAVSTLSWTIAPDFFHHRMSALLRSGSTPAEQPWKMDPTTNAAS
ncbi:MAG: hypothetical protein JWR63_1613 [Conexibacter sp.]|nr:hypothetical protein [Conexibacter sp.]